MPYEVVNMSNTQSNSSSTMETTDKHPVCHAKPLKWKKVGASHEYLNSPAINSNQRSVIRDHTGNQVDMNTLSAIDSIKS